MRTRQVVRAIGIVLVSAGVLFLLFAAYEVWGTGFTTAAHQRSLRSQFQRQLSVAQGPSGLVGADAHPTDGQPVAIIQIPAIGVDFVVVQGTDEADLEAGPGHYVDTPMPGNPGNAAIAGHRTTYLHPFFHLDALAPGDPIYVTTTQGRFRYDVTGTRVVAPTDVAVLDATTAPTLTLTTCNPRYSAATRMVVTASLAPTTPVRPVVVRPSPAADAPDTTTGSWPAAVGWGAAAAAVVGVVAVAGLRRRRRWWLVAVGGVAVLALLALCFSQLAPLLPTGY